MKVLVWGINYAPEATGIAPYNVAMCEYLRGKGHEARMLTTFAYYPEWRKRAEDRGSWYRTDVVRGVPVHRCWHYVPEKVSALKRIVHEGTFVACSFVRGLVPVAAVKTALDTAYAVNSNFATGQIKSTTLAAGQTLGYGDNGTDTVTVRVTLAGDADLDGDVDFNDFLKLQGSFGSAGTRFDQGNFNYDGQTDFNDFLALQGNFGQTVGFDSAAPQFTAAQYAQVMAITSAAAVPEPTTLALLGLGAAGLLRRRR